MLDRCALLDSFPPTARPAALVTARRWLADGTGWNAVSVSRRTRDALDPTLVHLVAPRTGTLAEVPLPATATGWAAAELFCDRGAKALARVEREQGRQRLVTSRAILPAPHLLGALLKRRRGDDLIWEAEFLDVPDGEEPTPGSGPADGGTGPGPWAGPLVAALAEAGVAPPEDPTTTAWARHLACALADTLVLAHPHQLTALLDALADDDLAARVRGKAVIRPEPAPPAWCYDRATAPILLDRHRAHIAHLGPVSAAVGAVVAAVGALADEGAGRLTLHLFAPESDDLDRVLERSGRPADVVVERPLPHLDQLATLTGFDVLLVADTPSRAGARVNPHLPPGTSDLLGSGRPLWTLVEPGSMLTRVPAEHRSPLGDVDGAGHVLRTIIERKAHHGTR